MLSQEGQQFLTKKGRLPTRPDVATNPPGVIEILQQKKIIVTISSAAEQRKMQQTFKEIFPAAMIAGRRLDLPSTRATFSP